MPLEKHEWVRILDVCVGSRQVQKQHGRPWWKEAMQKLPPEAVQPEISSSGSSKGGVTYRNGSRHNKGALEVAISTTVSKANPFLGHSNQILLKDPATLWVLPWIYWDNSFSSASLSYVGSMAFAWARVKIGEWAGANSNRASARLFTKKAHHLRKTCCDRYQSRNLQLPCLN